MPTTNTTWTVSIIAQYHPSIKEEYVDLEASILTQSYSPSIRYVIFFYDQVNKTAIIKQSEKSPNGSIVLHTVENLGRIDFYTNTKDLIYFFSKYSSDKGSFTAGTNHKHFLVGFGHGSGFGFFTQKPEEQPLDIFDKLLPVENRQRVLDLLRSLSFLKTNMSVVITKDVLKYLAEKLISQKIITKTSAIDIVHIFEKVLRGIRAEDFADAIHKGLNKSRRDDVKVSVMLSVNCYMQTIETGYALKDVVELLIAPQTTIPFFGYHYTKLFELLHTNPDVDHQEIAENVTNYYPIKYTEDSMKKVLGDLPRYTRLDVKNDVVITANRLKCYDHLIKSLNRIACHFIHNLDNEVYLNLTLRKVIETSIKKCGWVTAGEDSGVIDFLHFFEKIAYRHNNKYVEKLIKPVGRTMTFIAKKHRLSIYNNSNKLYNTNFNQRDFPTVSPTFFSIFLPICINSLTKRDILYQVYKPGTQNDVGFYRDSHWDCFIYKFLDILHNENEKRRIQNAMRRGVSPHS